MAWIIPWLLISIGGGLMVVRIIEAFTSTTSEVVRGGAFVGTSMAVGVATGMRKVTELGDNLRGRSAGARKRLDTLTKE